MPFGKRLGVLLVAASLASGCGSDSNDKPATGSGSAPPSSTGAATPGLGAESTPAENDQQEVINVLTAYLRAVGAGDGETACRQLTDQAAEKVPDQVATVSPEMKGRPCEEALVAFSQYYGDALKNPRIENVEVSGSSATAVGPLDEKATLSKVGDEWKIEQYGD